MLEDKDIEKIKPGVKLRIYDQTGRFEGVVLARKHGKESGGTFTVRGVVAGVGVEKIYPIYSPVIKKMELVAEPKRVRRSKIYFIRDLSKKQMQRKIGVTLK